MIMLSMCIQVESVDWNEFTCAFICLVVTHAQQCIIYIHLMSILITILTWISMVYGISSVHHLQFYYNHSIFSSGGCWVWFYPWKLSLAVSYLLHLIPGECDHMQKAFNHIGCCCNFRWIIGNYGSFLLVQFILYTVSLPSLITF